MRCVALLLAAAALLGAEDHHHHAAHGGVLNEIGGCENGHAEVKIEGSRLRLWFVAGGHHTDDAVRVPETRLELKDAQGRVLVLEPTPLTLAEEQVGDCSAFAGEAPWLAGLTQGRLEGRVTFRGKAMPLILTWPDGYEADGK